MKLERLYNLIALVDVNDDQVKELVETLNNVLKARPFDRSKIEKHVEKYVDERSKIQTAFRAFFDALHGKNRFNSDPLYHRGLELFGDYSRRNIERLVENLKRSLPELIEG